MLYDGVLKELGSRSIWIGVELEKNALKCGRFRNKYYTSWLIYLAGKIGSKQQGMFQRSSGIEMVKKN